MLNPTVSELCCLLWTAVSTEHGSGENQFVLQHGEGFILGRIFSGESPKNLLLKKKKKKLPSFIFASFGVKETELILGV